MDTYTYTFIYVYKTPHKYNLLNLHKIYKSQWNRKCAVRLCFLEKSRRLPTAIKGYQHG